MEMLHRKPIHLIWFSVHFFLIVAVCCKETLWLIGRGLTVAPVSFTRWCDKTEKHIEAARIGNGVWTRMPGIGIATYLHSAGTESGYGYFGPVISDSSQLIFELHYSDGRVDYDVPGVGSDAAGLRVASLLDRLSDPNFAPLREWTIKMLTYSIWREHPDAEMVRSILASVRLPSIQEFENGTKESHEFLYAYDYTRGHEALPAR
jgi:hypothetical protein